MNILAIETSCDETAISIIKAQGEIKNYKMKVFSNVILSQAKLHEKYGGVFPNLAKREHSKNLVPTLKQALSEAKMLNTKQTVEIRPELKKKLTTILEREPELLRQFLEFIPSVQKPKIDMIAVTQGPGLEPALWVGINFAKTLSEIWKLPIVPVNHMEGHITSVLADHKSSGVPFPAIALLISGGHTELVVFKKWGKYEVVGSTRDDAVGECFDKVARMLNLPYPGGPHISDLAEKERAEKSGEIIDFPRPMIHSPDLDFSFAGLKTSVLYFIQKQKKIDFHLKQRIAKSFEDAVAEVLILKTKKAIEKYKAKSLIIAGGVSANKFLRESFHHAEFAKKTKIFIPRTTLSTDNALMIATAGYFKVKSGKKITKNIKAEGNLSL